MVPENQGHAMPVLVVYKAPQLTSIFFPCSKWDGQADGSPGLLLLLGQLTLANITLASQLHVDILAGNVLFRGHIIKANSSS